MTTKRIYQTKYPILITTNTKERFCIFGELECAEIAARSLFFMEDIYKFDLLGYIIMPEHIHVLLMAKKYINMSEIIQRYKSYVYHQMRKQLGVKDKIWQKSFDYRIKNNLGAFLKAIEYIKNNPSKWQLPGKYYKSPYLYINKSKIAKIKRTFEMF